jgi:polyisoprenyl-teichoic acid--peptidoglycan teichoic acid transferase
MEAESMPLLRRTWPQRVLLVIGVGLVVASLTAAWALAGFADSVGDISRVAVGEGVLDGAGRSGAGGPTNILLVGTTENDGVDRNDPLLAGRPDTKLADTIMVLRVEPGSGQAIVMSINRDTWIDSLQGKINAAMRVGGIESLVRAVQTTLDIPINDFAIVNFAGFRTLVDELNGVPVYFAHPAKDEGSFFTMPTAGCHVLDGATALNYVRSRHYEEQINGSWVADNGDDYRRAERQRDFLVLTLDRVIDKGGRNPATMKRLLNAVTSAGAVTLDDRMSIADLLKLGTNFANFDPDSLQRVTLPTTEQTIRGQDVLRVNLDEAQPTLNIFRGLGDTLQPDQVSIRVVETRSNVTDARKPADVLADARFRVVARQTARAGDKQSRTTITYSADERNAALLLARNLAVVPNFKSVVGLDQLSLTIGTDWQGLAAQPRPESDFAGLVPGVAAPPAAGAPAAQAPATTAAPAADDAGIIGRSPPGTSCK